MAYTIDSAGSGLFAPIEPYDSGFLSVGGSHRLYWEESGRPDGIPVVFLHGGPGAGCAPTHRRFFDPQHYRIILFDQRGSGRSTPPGSLENNTTPDLVADMERLRAHLHVDRWVVFGGSWGSTLALAYAEAHPDRCKALILRGIFMGEDREIEWFLHGIGRFFPEAHRAFVEAIPSDERNDLLDAYYRRLTAPERSVRRSAALIWSRYEGACSTLLPSQDTVLNFSEVEFAERLARIEAHYFVNRVFMPEGALLANVQAIRHIPAVIVQGRYDMVCPIETADRLSRAWPEATYDVVPDAGHAALEPGIRKALIAATERFKRLQG